MVSRKLKDSGFTLVELLAVIVIIGILSVTSIVGVNRLINKAKNDSLVEQENSVKMAAQSYTQDNRSMLPKGIGDKTTIYVSTLKDSNYLKDDIKNSSGESCMENSTVTVYKSSKTKYDYEVNLYCGSEVPSTTDTVTLPTITIKLTDDTGETGDDILNNVGEAYVRIDIEGGTHKDKNTGTIKKLKIDSYNYSISVGTSKRNASNTVINEMQEVYNSGTISGGGKEKISIQKKIVELIDITKVSSVKIHVVARNTEGGLYTDDYTLGGGTSSSGSFEDKIPPTCNSIDNQATSNKDWINKSKYNNGKKRVITANCTDGKGSGCIRSTFSRTWPTENEEAAIYSYIQVKDNAGNTNIKDAFFYKNLCSRDDSQADSNCRVLVNVDIDSPKIKLTAGYNNTSNNTNILTSTNTSSGGSSTSTDSYTYTADKYKDLVNGWMNNSNYSTGITYKFTITDNLEMASWVWETNPKGISSATDSNYNKFSATNDDAKKGTTYAEATNNCDGKKSDTITVSLTAEGLRQGKLTVKDYAGNTTVYIVEAKIDRTAPSKPTTVKGYKYDSKTASSYNTNKEYAFNSWTNSYIGVVVSAPKTDNISGFDHFEKATKYESNNYSAASSGNTYKVQVDGIHKIKFRSCDKAGNCSSYGSEYTIKLDTTSPKCNVTATKNGTTTTYSGTWLKIGEYATVTASCQEQKSGNATYSGCKTSAFSYKYDGNYNITNGGAKGKGLGGSVSDNAGNTTYCAADKTIKVDHEAPKFNCNFSGTYTNNNNNKGTITLSGVSDNYGVSTKQYYFNSWQSSNSKSNYMKCGKNKYTGKAKLTDVAGNVTEKNCSGSKTTRACVAPSISCDNGGWDWTNGSRTITFSGRGLEYMQYTKESTSDWTTVYSNSSSYATSYRKHWYHGIGEDNGTRVPYSSGDADCYVNFDGKRPYTPKVYVNSYGNTTYDDSECQNLPGDSTGDLNCKIYLSASSDFNYEWSLGLGFFDYYDQGEDDNSGCSGASRIEWWPIRTAETKTKGWTWRVLGAAVIDNAGNRSGTLTVTLCLDDGTKCDW